ncbi:MAG TPA: hypothetical protein VGG03_20835 [Thermoanaerobaculia bacterium]|jgi:hypothetical protein
MTTHTNRTIAKVCWPVLLLTATLSLPAVSLAAPSPKDKAHATEKANKGDKHQNRRQKDAWQNQGGKATRKQQRQQEWQSQHQQRQSQSQQQQRFEAQQRAETRRQAALQARQQRQLEAQRKSEVRRQAEVQRQLRLQQQAELKRQAQLQKRSDRSAYRAPAPAPVYRDRNRAAAPVYRDRYADQGRYAARTRPWYGWNNRRGYSRYGSGQFQLDGTYIGQQYGCALVQDHQGQVIPLLGNPGDLRKGEHVLLSGRVQNSSVCGSAFRVYNVDTIWADANHRRVLFDSRYDGDYRSERYNDRYNRDRYDDRYDDRYGDDRYDDRYDDRDDDRLISVTGHLDRGLACTSIDADNGDRYALSGDLQDYRDGDRVRVIGFLGGRSLCGARTIEVEEIRGR